MSGNRNSDLSQIGVLCPKDWLDFFRKSASLEGLVFSDFVLTACLERACAVQGKDPEKVKGKLTQKAKPGRKKGATACGSK